MVQDHYGVLWASQNVYSLIVVERIHCNIHIHIFRWVFFSLHISLPFRAIFLISGAKNRKMVEQEKEKVKKTIKNGWWITIHSIESNFSYKLPEIIGQGNNKLKQKRVFPKHNQRTTFCSPFAMKAKNKQEERYGKEMKFSSSLHNKNSI